MWGHKPGCSTATRKVEEAESRFAEGVRPQPELSLRSAAPRHLPLSGRRSSRRRCCWLAVPPKPTIPRPHLSGRGVFHHLRVRNASESACGCSRRPPFGDALRRPPRRRLRNSFDALFGPQGRLPAAARRRVFVPQSLGGVGRRREAWNKALQTADTPRLGDLVPLVRFADRRNIPPMWPRGSISA